MKDVLSFIEQKKQEFARLPLFEFMQDTSIDPRSRLAWAPCAAFFIMSFGELNKSIFRDPGNSDPIQKLINTHTHEDDHHWVWFLQDLEKLGFDYSWKFSDSLKFLWGEETQVPRWVIYSLANHAITSTPLQKLVIIEVLEATGNIVFEHASQVAIELQKISGQQYNYFGAFHLSVETGHTTGNKDIDSFLASIKINKHQEKDLLELSNNVFNLISNLASSLLVYAQNSTASSFASPQNQVVLNFVSI